jgi:hypothetical protein
MIDQAQESAFLKTVLDTIIVDGEGVEPPKAGDPVEEKKLNFYELFFFNGTYDADVPYAMYEGSLTSPPCTEDILWVIFLDDIKASQEQIKFIDNLFVIKPSRHLQNLNRRALTYGTYEQRSIMDAISKRIIRKKEEYFGILPA